LNFCASLFRVQRPSLFSSIYANEQQDAIRRKPDILGLDPFVKLHSLEESNSADMDFVCGLLAKFAIEFNIAVDSPHHVHKGTIAPGDADAGRGSSGIRDAGRLIYTLTPMAESEAKLLGIDPEERHAYVRLDGAKVNIAARSGNATWFKIIGVPIGNSTREYPSGASASSARNSTMSESN
jgi:RecA-family ATPase